MLMVYGKKKTDLKFKPFNMKENTFQVNKMYGSLFEIEQKPALEKEVAFMNEKNPDYAFEIRKAGK
jgi:hypothetical protein